MYIYIYIYILYRHIYRRISIYLYTYTQKESTFVALLQVLRRTQRLEVFTDESLRREVLVLELAVRSNHRRKLDGRAVTHVHLDKYKKINMSHTHTHTPTENNTPDTDTHTHDKNKTPNPQTNSSHNTLNKARRWRDDGACHLPRPGGWPRRSEHK